jgi:hypothetical protein
LSAHNHIITSHLQQAVNRLEEVAIQMQQSGVLLQKTALKVFQHEPVPVKVCGVWVGELLEKLERDPI